jgi:hypothetical protein
VNVEREYVCDDGQVSPGFVKVTDSSGRKANSFNTEEVKLLWQMMKVVQRGGDTSILTRSPVLGKLSQKIRKMTLKKGKAEG